RQLGADLFREVVCQVAFVGGAAVQVVKIAICWYPRVDGLPQCYGGGGFVKPKVHRPGGGGGDRQQQGPPRRIAGADQQRGGAAARLGERTLPDRGPVPECRSRQVNPAQQFAGTKDVAVIAGDEIDRPHLACRSVTRPERKPSLEGDDQRDYRPSRQ